jgi:hypothetical protein
MVNSTRHAQLVVRCNNPNDAEVLDYSRGLFKFDDKLIKCIKVHSVGLLPEEEDDIQTASIQNFPHSAEGHSILNYPSRI